MAEKNISHDLITYDLLEYNFKDIYQSFSISYFTDDKEFINNYIDLDELRNYESIEKDNNVLIKKFKLRISLNKNQKFSDEFLVCDTVDFNCKELKNFDSIIKIAIIKEDIEKWLNSDNIYNYDFIFTIDEYYDELKKNFYHILKIKGKSIYLQLKNILNSLYNYKKEQFFHFTNNKFKNVFPKVRNYFKVFHSEFYDEEWYRQTYNIPNNTDPVFHYLIIGNEKGYNPGPDFNSLDYYELNMDVKESKLNPLVHYEMHGRKQNRQYKFSKEDIDKKYNVISNSPYFDREWYKATYDLDDGTDLAKHYLEVGFKKKFNPGPDFDGLKYYEDHEDAKEMGINPLLHYELYVRYSE